VGDREGGGGGGDSDREGRWERGKGVGAGVGGTALRRAGQRGERGLAGGGGSVKLCHPGHHIQIHTG
jgi:hypothetical protein